MKNEKGKSKGRKRNNRQAVKMEKTEHTIYQKIPRNKRELIIRVPNLPRI